MFQNFPTFVKMKDQDQNKSFNPLETAKKYGDRVIKSPAKTVKKVLTAPRPEPKSPKK